MKTLEQLKDDFIIEWIDSEWMEYTQNCFIYDLNVLIEKAKEEAIRPTGYHDVEEFYKD